MGQKRSAIEILLSLRDKVSGPLAGIRSTMRALKDQSRETREALEAVGSAGKKMLAFGAGAAAGIGYGVVQAAKFQNSMAEISTLVDTGIVNMDSMSQSVLALSKQYGSMPVATAAGFYQTLSAGFGDVADAQTIMTASLKLGRGGLTDTFTSVDGLTSVLNAYGLGAAYATSVSDGMFMAVVKGKTKIAELSEQLGMVAPLAAKAMSVDEMLATVSALTLGGKKTAVAVTGLRGMLVAILKPTADAEAIAKKLGITFSTAGIKQAGGFAKWMEILTQKTKGSEVVLAKLFGDVEGLGAALSLTGIGAKQFTDILEAMKNKTGATETAFNKMNATAVAAYDRAKAGAAVTVIELSTHLLPWITRCGQKFTVFLDKFSEFRKMNPELVRHASYWGILGTEITLATAAATIFVSMAGKAYLTVLKPVLLALLWLWRSLVWAVIWGALKMAVSLWIAVPPALAFAAAIAANPITWMVLSVIALAGAVALLIIRWGQASENLNTLGLLMGSYMDLVQAWARNMYHSGVAFVQNLWDGIKAHWGKFLVWIESALGKLKGFFWQSDPKFGPMRNTTAMGRAFPATLAKGMLANSGATTNAAENMMRRLRPAVDFNFQEVNSEMPNRRPTPANRQAFPRYAGGNRIGAVHVTINGGGKNTEREVENALGRVFDRYSYEVGR